MIGRRRGAGVAVAVALAAALAAAPAGAGGGAATKVTIHYDGVHAPHGRVFSRKAICRRHRKVWLRGIDASGSSSRLDFTFTNRRGKWVLETQLQGAKALRAKAPPKVARGVRCAPDRSRSVPTGL
jgi:hypothetical protein